MKRIHGRTWWAISATVFGAAAAAFLQFLAVPAFAGYELPPGERITNLPPIPRSIPQKEAYEIYDPVIGRNFDIKNLWMRADLRVRPEFRQNTCFGASSASPACNTFGARGANATNGNRGNDFYVQQWVRLGIGYDLSPDVNFYMEIIDSATWGGNGNPLNAGNGGDPLNHNCGPNVATAGAGALSAGTCRLGVRAAYVLVRNFAGVEGLSMKAGRQYLILGNHSIFGHFDWANTGYSHDGVMFQYDTKTFTSWLGWFRNSESDLPQAAPVGSGGPNIAGGAAVAGGAANLANDDAHRDADMIVFYNQIKSVPGFIIEPYYIYYKNNYGSFDNQNLAGSWLGTPKHSNQTRHHIGNRIEMRKGNWDFINETAWQFGQMGAGGTGGATVNACGGDAQAKCLHINAWATRTWIGYTHYQHAWKPRLAFNLDYASGDGRNGCQTSAANNATVGGCRTANTFENFFPTNHIHMGYADVQAWKNMFAPQINLQFRPSARDHIELWYMNMNTANKRDCWYRAAQVCYVNSNLSSANNSSHIGDELDFTWTRMFADGKIAFQTTYGHIWTGKYVSNNLGFASNQHWGYAQIWMNF